MPREAKIEKEELNRMLAEGKSVKECAEHFGVSLPAISKAKKQLGQVIAMEVQMEAGSRFVDEYLDTIEQLRIINENAHELLNLCMNWVRGEGEAIQVLESQLSTKKVRVGDEERLVEEVKMTDPKIIALKAMERIESQLKTQNQTLSLLAEAKGIVEFRQEVADLLNEMDPSGRLKNEFRRRICQRSPVYRALRISKQG